MAIVDICNFERTTAYGGLDVLCRMILAALEDKTLTKKSTELHAGVTIMRRENRRCRDYAQAHELFA